MKVVKNQPNITGLSKRLALKLGSQITMKFERNSAGEAFGSVGNIQAVSETHLYPFIKKIISH